MKKVILAAVLLASAGAVSAFTLKHDTVRAKYDTIADKKDLGTADDKKDLGTADDKKDLGTADAQKHSTTNDKKDLGTAD
ncbi:MAG TPA: hypothetical protein VHB54_01815 [Mucilaginibacter sp.]|nr:hypothetical protein [Mucilaginibacter sp.]